MEEITGQEKEKMKRKPRILRLSTNDWLLMASPFPLLWLHVGLTVHPAVFQPWVRGQDIGALDAFQMGTLVIVFPIVYFPFVFTLSPQSKISVRAVIISTMVAYFFSCILTPLP